MPARKVWSFSPDSGGQKIPVVVKWDVERRLKKFAAEHFKGEYTRLAIRFRAQFCYIDAYTEPRLDESWPPEDWPETREEYAERLRNTPTHLCRLRYFGHDQWGFAFYTYSNEGYELAIFPHGDFLGKPEEAFFVSASLYLQD
jgi:hypothetical protein